VELSRNFLVKNTKALVTKTIISQQRHIGFEWGPLESVARMQGYPLVYAMYREVTEPSNTTKVELSRNFKKWKMPQNGHFWRLFLHYLDGYGVSCRYKHIFG